MYNVFIVCTGLGNINRGFETFTEECFYHLKDNDLFNLILIKGSGFRSQSEHKIVHLSRKSILAKLIGFLFKKDPYIIEQISFVPGLIFKIIYFKPKVIFFSDFHLGTYLWHFRNLLNFKYRLLFSNGAPCGPPYTRMDHVQHLLVSFYNKYNLEPSLQTTHSVLPYGFSIEPDFKDLSNSEILFFRNELKLPQNKKIVLSVGAINSFHKRMDYVIEEFSKLDQEKYFLLLLGNIDEFSSEIIRLAKNNLDKNSYLIKEVASNEVRKYFKVCDYFILASLTEGFGRVLIESLNAGLIPIVHDNNIFREILEQNGLFFDLNESFQLKKAILEKDNLLVSKSQLHNFAYHKYSWDVLRHKYIHMINSLVN